MIDGNDTNLVRLLGSLLMAILLLICTQANYVNSACVSCLPWYRGAAHYSHHHHHHHHQHHAVSAGLAVPLSYKSSTNSFRTTFVGFLLQRSVATPLAFAIGVTVAQRCLVDILKAAEEEMKNKQQTGDKDGNNEVDTNQEEDEEARPVTSAMVATIGIYKNFISPLLPPACRFLPTCSQYGVQAIGKFMVVVILSLLQHIRFIVLTRTISFLSSFYAQNNLVLRKG